MFLFICVHSFVMLIVKAAGVVGSFLTWVVVESLMQDYAVAFRRLRIVLGNLLAVTVLCVMWHGVSWMCLGDTVFLTTMGVTFRWTFESVKDVYKGRKGLMLGVLTGHLAAFVVALIWYVCAMVYIELFV